MRRAISLTVLTLSLLAGRAPALELGNVQLTTGLLGSKRTEAQFLPGDALFVQFDIRGLQVDPKVGTVTYQIKMEIFDNQGKEAFTQVAPPKKLLLPGGNRSAGMEQMLRAGDTGRLVSSEVDYQLHVIDVWYEKQPARALERLGRLRSRHPHNPHFPQAMAEIEDFYLDDTAASLRTWTTLLEAAQRGQVAESALAQANARLGIASQLDQLSRGEAALEHLHALLDARPTAPFAVIARAHLQLGQTLEHLGRYADATAAYRAAIEAAGRNDPLEIATRARTSLRAIERSSRSTSTQ